MKGMPANRSAIPVLFDPRYRAHLPGRHRFPMGKYLAVAEALRASSFAQRLRFLRPKDLSEAQVEAAHGYWPLVRDLALPPAMEKRLGLPLQPDVRDRALAAAAGSYVAALTALERGVACNLAGGSHHADYDTPAGFCTFNDVSIAAKALLSRRRVGRILVLDLDVHQGDGTARSFASEAHVTTVSLHCAQNFPFEKARSDMDVELAAGAQGWEYARALAGILEALPARDYDLLFYNAGIDPHSDDTLGRLALNDDDLAARDAQVLAWARRHDLPVVTVLGGGYQPDLARLGALHAQTVQQAARLFG